jgi:teichuronic acid biosynthesis glycosyltransferase TuaC
MNKKVLAVSNNFPSKKFPERGAFVLNIVTEMSKQGAVVDVIAPISWIAELKNIKNKPKQLNFGNLSVSSIYYTAIPQKIKSLKIQISKLNDLSFANAMKKKLKHSNYDFVYAHFFPSANAAHKVVEKYNLPIFLNLGESDPWDYDQLYGKDYWINKLHDFKGIITVSKRNYDYLLERDASLKSKVIYIPNGVNTKRFMPMDQKECRTKLGLPLDEKIAIFCGHFENRKGPLKVLEAINLLNIKGVFLGSNGPDVPEGENVLYAGPVLNTELPLWLNAADVFVLPSLSEGMSNAILEALGVGIPLVVSDLSFNTDFLTKDVAVFVDPINPRSIADGIQNALLHDNNVSMRKASYDLGQELSIENRIKKINKFVDDRIKSQQ